ncbi:MAG: hypothetical protein ABI700_23650 [Chloroflexota bacterium]
MSEDTEAVLFLNQNDDQVKTHMKDFPAPFIVRTLDDKWAALLLEGFYVPQVKVKLSDISNDVPLLYFADGEYGWAFEVYAGGAKVAALGTEAEDFDENADFTYRDYSPERCARCNFEALSVFDLDATTLHNLRAGLTAEPMPDRISMSGGAFFMDLVGIGAIWSIDYRHAAHFESQTEDDE